MAKKNVHIWDVNGSRKFLDSRGLTKNAVGDLGPVYGFQWRHFGAKYEGFEKDYHGEGVDQLTQVINLIKNDPFSRRIILSAWNPPDLEKMALPPCHCLCQFYVGADADGKPATLSCQLYQRSGDMGLGVPFNVASYALLTIMIAHVTSLEPYEFIHTLGDAHVYVNHEDALREQLSRTPRLFPKLKIKREVASIEDFSLDDFVLQNYHPYSKLEMKMAA